MKHTSMLFAMSVALSLVSSPLRGAIITKADNTEPLNSPDSWEGGIAPGAEDVAAIHEALTSRTLTLGDDLSWLGLSITNEHAGNFVFNAAANTLTLGSEGMYLVPTANRDYTFNCALVVAADQTWQVGRGKIIPTGGVDLGGHTLTLTGNMTKEFRSPVSGSGKIINTQNNFTFYYNGVNGAKVAAPDADLELNGGTFVLAENAIYGQTLPIWRSISLYGTSTLNLHGTSLSDSIISNATSLTSCSGGQSSITMQTKANYPTIFVSERFERVPGAGTIYVRGTGLGMHDPADGVAGTANVLFQNAPTLSGRGGAAGTPTVGFIPGMAASTNDAANVALSLATYDVATGIRPLDVETEYTTALVDGENDGNNVRIANVAGDDDSATKQFTLTEDTAINSLSLFTSGTGANGGIVIDAEPDAVLKIESGVILAALAISSPTSDKSSMAYLRAPIDLNGKKGLVHQVRETLGMSSGGGHGLLEISGGIFNDGGAGLVFAGPGSAHFNGAASTYAGPTVVNGGFVRILGQIPGDIIINGGQLQSYSNTLPDWADIYVNGGDYRSKGGAFNSGDGVTENFGNLYLTGGTYSCGGGGNGTMVLTNACVSGGTWSVARGMALTLYGDVAFSGSVQTLGSGNGAERNGGSITVYGRFAVTNTLKDAYTPLTIGYNDGTRNEARLVLKNPEAGFFFHGNPKNDNTALINANALPSDTAKRGAILINGNYPFDIGDGAAKIDLRINANIATDGDGALVKLGAGTLQLAGDNTYTGRTTVATGALLLDGSSFVGPVSAASGTTFGGSGSVGDDVALADDTTLWFDFQKDEPDTLTVAGAITGAGTTFVDVDLSGLENTEEAYYVLATATSGVTGTFVLPEAFTAKWQISILGRGTKLCASKKLSTLIIVR